MSTGIVRSSRTTITISKETKLKLDEVKVNLSSEKRRPLTFDEVIDILIQTYRKEKEVRKCEEGSLG